MPTHTAARPMRALLPTPTWATHAATALLPARPPGPNKASRPRCAARCCAGMSGAVASPVAGMPPSSICITSGRAPKAAATARTISSRCARPITARCTGASCAAQAMPSDFRVLQDALVVPGQDGAPLPPAASSSLDVPAKVTSGLCQLGFRAADVHAVIAELRQRSELADAAPQQWLREALRRLHRAPERHR